MAEVRAFKNSVKQAAGELAAQRRRDAVEYALRARTGPVDASCLVKEARIIEKYLAKG